MKQTRLILLSFALFLVCLGSGEAWGQTRLTVLGGGLIPFGDLDDTAEPSARFGLRAEFQPVNAIGQRRLLSFHLTGAYSTLDRDASVVLADPEGSDAYLGEISGGVRAYSSVAPFFVTGGVGYSRFHPGAGGDGVNGIEGNAGLGFLLPTSLVLLEAEGTWHQVFAENDVAFSYLSVLLGIGLPF